MTLCLHQSILSISHKHLKCTVNVMDSSCVVVEETVEMYLQLQYVVTCIAVKCDEQIHAIYVHSPIKYRVILCVL